MASIFKIFLALCPIWMAISFPTNVWRSLSFSLLAMYCSMLQYYPTTGYHSNLSPTMQEQILQLSSAKNHEFCEPHHQPNHHSPQHIHLDSCQYQQLNRLHLSIIKVKYEYWTCCRYDWPGKGSFHQVIRLPHISEGKFEGFSYPWGEWRPWEGSIQHNHYIPIKNEAHGFNNPQ